MATLYASPNRVRKSQVKVITFSGTGTAWSGGSPPVFTPGLAGVSVGTVSVVSPTLATAPVTYGASVGLNTFTDTGTSAVARQSVQSVIPRWYPGL